MAPRVIGSSRGSLQEATAAAFDDEAFKEVDQTMRRCAGSRCTPSSRRSSPPDAPRRGGIMAGGCLTTAKDVLSLPEVELMALLDAGILTARAAVSPVGDFTCPSCQTALALLEERVRLGGGWRLATMLRWLDEALGGCIPLGKLTEVVGPSGIDKTQLYLKLALLATLPECYGGLNSRVVY